MFASTKRSDLQATDLSRSTLDASLMPPFAPPLFVILTPSYPCIVCFLLGRMYESTQ